jgi:hypothetical protein
MKYACRTLFDITATGITGHYKTSRIPFMDEAGQEIANTDDWNRARNQQRNPKVLRSHTKWWHHPLSYRYGMGNWL